jgi:hypothetical protein
VNGVEIHANILKLRIAVFHKLFGQHFEQDHHSIQMADHSAFNREHLLAHLRTFYTIVLQFLHSLHFGRKPQLAELLIAEQIINHSVGENNKQQVTSCVMVYKATSHVMLPRMREFSPAPTSVDKNKRNLLSE